MSKASGFWDASALVPLCVHEITSRQTHALLKRYAPVVWWGSLVELNSAISRLHRQGQLNDIEKKGALARLAVLNRGWKEILPEDALRELACDLLGKYFLPSADSLQLAAALTWCQQRPSRRIFISGDERLCDAAEASGFSIIRLARPTP